MDILEKARIILKNNNIEEFDIDFIMKKAATLKCINMEEANQVTEILKSFDISIYNSSGVPEFKLFLLDPEDVRNKLDSLKSVNELDLYRIYPEKLIENPTLKYYQRITTCQRSNIQYKNEEGFYEYIIDDEKWNNFANGQIDLSNLHDSISQAKEYMKTLDEYNNSFETENYKRSLAA